MMRGLTLAIVCGLMIGVPAGAAAQQGTELYDGFFGPLIDPVRWRGQESFKVDTLGVRNTEITRRLVGRGVAREAELFMRTFGSAGLDRGTSGSAHLRLLINHPALIGGNPAITVLNARVTINSVVTNDCAANTTETTSRAQVLGFFFNDGTGNATVGDLNGDIVAGIQLERNSKLGDRIVGFINRCGDAPCGNSTSLKGVVFTRAWTLNVAELLTVRWRKSRKEFEFEATSATGGYRVQVLTYGDILLFDGEPAKQNGNSGNQGVFIAPVAVQNSIANCMAAPLETSIGARFDSVRLDGEAVRATQ